MDPFLLEEGLPATPQPELLRLVAIALDCGAAWGQEQPAGRRSPLWKDPRIHSYLLVHEAQGTTWFDRDRCVDLVTALTTAATLVLLRDPALSRSELTTVLAQLGQRQAEILDAAAAAGYRLDNFLESI
jgi:hypothetical protein